MMERLRLNNRGFTLIEFLVAVVIISAGLLALLQSVNLSISHNLTNIFRNQAVMLADERMALEKTKPFECISTTTKSMPVSLFVKDANAFKNYSVVKTGTSISNNTTQVDITVTWAYKGARYQHIISSLASRYQQ